MERGKFSTQFFGEPVAEAGVMRFDAVGFIPEFGNAFGSGKISREQEMSYTLELSPDMDSILRTRASRRGLTPEDYLRAITEDRLRPRRGANGSLTEEEQQAITLLNAELPPEFWRRYAELTHKLRGRTITEPEHEEIKQLAAQEEAWGGKRILLLQTMARQRNLPLLAFMKRNNIRHHPDADRFMNTAS